MMQSWQKKWPQLMSDAGFFTSAWHTEHRSNDSSFGTLSRTPPHPSPGDGVNASASSIACSCCDICCIIIASDIAAAAALSWLPLFRSVRGQ